MASSSTTRIDFASGSAFGHPGGDLPRRFRRRELFAGLRKLQDARRVLTLGAC
jgi:hypothetical protein